MFIRVMKFLIAFNLIGLLAALSCNLNLWDEKWLDDWHLLVTSAGNQNYQLLRTNKVAGNSNLLMFCKEEPHLTLARCQANGKFDRILPIKHQCKEIGVDAIKEKHKVPYCPYDLYKIGYNITLDKVTHFLEVYQVCFDQKHLRTLFAINKVYPIADGRPDFLQFNSDEFFRGNYFYAFARGNTFNRFKKLLGNKQSYMDAGNVDHIIDRGHMVPSGDFVTTNLKRASFKMINVMPQFKTIDDGNWRNIEKWSRRAAHTGNTICTGVFDCNLDSKTVSDLHCVVQLKSTTKKMVPIFLADDRKIPIPLWTYKILKEQKIVFLTLNNIYHQATVPVPVNICKEILCPKTLQLGATVKQGITFCCDYDHFITTNVPKLVNVC